MSSRRFGVSTKDGEISPLWEQREIKERFVGVGKDLDDFFFEEMELNKRFPVEFQGLHKATIMKSLKFFKCSLEDRFNELNNSLATVQPRQNFINDDDKINLGEL